jgi:hypothetical protein
MNIDLNDLSAESNSEKENEFKSSPKNDLRQRSSKFENDVDFQSSKRPTSKFENDFDFRSSKRPTSKFENDVDSESSRATLSTETRSSKKTSHRRRVVVELSDQSINLERQTKPGKFHQLHKRHL